MELKQYIFIWWPISKSNCKAKMQLANGDGFLEVVEASKQGLISYVVLIRRDHLVVTMFGHRHQEWWWRHNTLRSLITFVARQGCRICRRRVPGSWSRTEKEWVFLIWYRYRLEYRKPKYRNSLEYRKKAYDWAFYLLNTGKIHQLV